MGEKGLPRSLRVLVGFKEPNSLIPDVGDSVGVADSRILSVKEETDGIKWDSLS